MNKLIRTTPVGHHGRSRSRSRIAKLAGLFCLVLAPYVQASDLTVMAHTGDGVLTAINDNIAINKEGIIAFTGTDSTGSRVWAVSEPNKAAAVSTAATGRTQMGVGITSGTDPMILSRELVNGPAFVVREWDIGTGASTIVGSSVTSSGPADFDSASSLLDVSSTGTAVVSALFNGSTSTEILMGATRPLTQIATYSDAQPFRPQISDTNEAVFRDNLGRIIAWPYPSGSPFLAASPANSFTTATGNRPGISTNGTAISFTGDRGAGAGVYVTVRLPGKSPMVVNAAGGELADGFGTFNGEQRVAVRARHSKDSSNRTVDIFTVVFEGQLHSVDGIYSRDITLVNGVAQPLGDVTTLVKIGDPLLGAKVSSFALYRPINDAGQIAFTVHLDNNTVAIVRTSAGPIWGAKVRLTPITGDPTETFLVSVENGQVYTQQDVTVAGDGSVSVAGGTPLSALSRIDVIPDPTPATPNLEVSGFNKYCTLDNGAAVELAVQSATGQALPAYQDGVGWNLVNTATGLLDEYDAATNLYAVPRCKAPSDWIAPDKRIGQPAMDAGLKSAIATEAQNLSIPPLIMWGKLWGESKAPVSASKRGFGKVSWNQYGFISTRLNAPGVPVAKASSEKRVYRDDPAGQERTLVTYDGGIGIGQITGATAVNTAQPNQLILDHLYHLANDLSYNVHTAAAIIEAKRQMTLGARDTPIGDSSTAAGKTIVEHWYNALWGYNGFPDGKTDISSKAPVYPDRIFGFIQGGGAKRWVYWLPALGSYKVKSPVKSGYFIDAARTTLGTDKTTLVAHADVDLDGLIDVVLSAPKMIKGKTNDEISVVAKTDPTRAAVAVASIQASISGGGLATPVVLPLIAAKGGVFMGTIAGHFAGSATPYTVTFSATINGVSAGGNQLDGVTWQFSVKP